VSAELETSKSMQAGLLVSRLVSGIPALAERG
jgi:hypothetical protein